ncbi:hypothetical protein [Rossellomorea sp. FM04394]|uniref:hypothetical protein n=1 Tax=Rossellomorea sp. FM04394 TaxID=3243076 RepID=UPI0035A5BC11
MQHLLEPRASSSAATVFDTCYIVSVTTAYSSAEIFPSNKSSYRNSKVVSISVKSTSYIISITEASHTLTSLFLFLHYTVSYVSKDKL